MRVCTASMCFELAWTAFGYDSNEISPWVVSCHCGKRRHVHPSNLYQYSFSLALPKNTDTTATSIGYNTLLQELTRMSSYFCEKAGAGGLIGVHLVTVQRFSSFVATGVSIHLQN